MPQQAPDIESFKRGKVENRRALILRGRDIFDRFTANGGKLGSFVRALFIVNATEEFETQGYVEDIRLSGFDVETQTPAGVINLRVAGHVIKMRSLLELELLDPNGNRAPKPGDPYVVGKLERTSLALERRAKDLSRMHFSEIYADEEGELCCEVTVACHDGISRNLIFAWDAESQMVDRVDEEGDVPLGLFLTARNSAKDRLREAAANANRH